MWRRKKQKKSPDEGTEPLLSELIPFVELVPIILPERLSSKARKEQEKAPKEEADNEDARIDGVVRDFLMGRRSARERIQDITKKSHK